LAQFIPYGGTVADLIVLKYSRDMERQADILGTRLLATTGYAADGMWNLTVTLEKQERDRPAFIWLSSHPVTDERVEYIQNLIERNGYNRYAYEGVERHQQIKARLKQLLEQEKLRQERQEQGGSEGVRE
jgi:predicted Zn-dependent protease